jgi:uncharacterized protein (DUF1501 family)
MAITRRQFLKRSATATAALALGPHLRRLPGTGVAYAAGPGDAIVVLVQLYGGNDGLNTVYPVTGFQRTKYEEFRPTLKLPKIDAEMAPGDRASAPRACCRRRQPERRHLRPHPAMGALQALPVGTSPS